MTEPTSARAERATRLAEQLTGTSQRRGARAVRAGGAGNLLWGVALHTAARLDAGLELSDLEQRLAFALLKLMPEDEVREWGRAWEQARRRGAVPGFPEAAVRLAPTESYSLHSLRQDLPGIGAQVLAQPNMNVVRVGEAGYPGPVDSEEFLAAAEEAGCGLTVVLGPEPAGADVASALSAEVHIPYFICKKGTGDSFFGGRDEIYWAIAAGSDSRTAWSYCSPEFGAVEEGDKRSFPAGAAVFTGLVNKVMFFDVECWEKDRGGFWDDIKDALFDVAEACVDSSVEVMEHGEREDAALAALVGIVSAIMGALLDIILGQDDLIQHRTMSFSRSALDTLIDKAGGDFDFRGEGAHYVLRIGARRLPSYMRYITLDAGSSTWSAPGNMPGMHTMDNPGTATFENRLYCVVRPPGTASLDFTSFDGYEWTEPRRGINPAPVSSGVGMGVIYGSTVTMVTRLGQAASQQKPGFYHVRPGGELSTAISTGPMVTDATPNAADGFSEVSVVFRGSGNTDLYFSEVALNGNWSPPAKVPDSAGRLGPGVAKHGAEVHVVHRSLTTDDLRHHVYHEAHGWRTMGPLGGHFSVQRPALASFDGKLHCVYRGHNNKNLWWTTWDGTQWATARLLSAAASVMGPDLTVLNGRLYCVYHDDV